MVKTVLSRTVMQIYIITFFDLLRLIQAIAWVQSAQRAGGTITPRAVPTIIQCTVLAKCARVSRVLPQGEPFMLLPSLAPKEVTRLLPPGESK